MSEIRQLPFTKMEAQGNDFVILNAIVDQLPEIDERFARTITERRFGIGCDQLLVIERCANADARMVIFNNDGSRAANCGNGLRCVAALLMAQLAQGAVSIALDDRVVHATGSAAGICVEMGGALVNECDDGRVDVEIGNPHSVFFEATTSFPHDRNVEIVTGQIADHLYIDIIERGAGRTLACGSGACAAAAALWRREGAVRPLTIVMPGGEVTVAGDFDNLLLEGAVHQTFSGIYLLRDG